MDQRVSTSPELEAERRALRADNERLRAQTLDARERALALAARCDTLEAEVGMLRRRLAWRVARAWPFGRRPE